MRLVLAWLSEIDGVKRTHARGTCGSYSLLDALKSDESVENGKLLELVFPSVLITVVGYKWFILEEINGV